MSVVGGGGFISPVRGAGCGRAFNRRGATNLEFCIVFGLGCTGNFDHILDSKHVARIHGREVEAAEAFE
jgi:hypothetical protein